MCVPACVYVFMHAFLCMFLRVGNFRIYLDHLDDPEAAVNLVQESESTEGAGLVAKYGDVLCVCVLFCAALLPFLSFVAVYWVILSGLFAVDLVVVVAGLSSWSVYSTVFFLYIQ